MNSLVDKTTSEDAKKAIRINFYDSLKHQQLKTQGICRISLPVTLTGSDNEYLKYPVRGVLTMLEQKTDLRMGATIFNRLLEDGSLDVPVRVSNPKFIYE